MGGEQKAGFLYLLAEPRCSPPLLHRAVRMLLYGVVTELGKSTDGDGKCLRGAVQPLPLHGVEGGVMDQTLSKAWLELDVFFPWKY